MLQFRNIRLLTTFLCINILIISCSCGEGSSPKKNLPEDKKKYYSSEDILRELHVKRKKLWKGLEDQIDPTRAHIIMDNFERMKVLVEEDLDDFSKLNKNDALLLMSQLELDENIKSFETLRTMLQAGENNPNAYDLVSEDIKNELMQSIVKTKIENIDWRRNTPVGDSNHFFTKNNFSRAYLVASHTLKILRITKKMLELKINNP